MRFRSLPNLFRNVKRWTEILSALSKYGLADWLSGTNVDFIKDRLITPNGEVLARLTREARIRLALSELGPTFIKLGQVLSTRPDIVGGPLAEELKQLQSAAPADSPAKVREVVERELGGPLEELFDAFEPQPIASASIGQVHRARLKTGEPVVVKVQHADIERTVNEDLEVLAGLASLAEHIPEFQPYRPTATLAEAARTLRRELDFGREERNLTQFAAMFRDDYTVAIPQSFTELSTARVLTMEKLEGLPISPRAGLLAAGIDPDEVARRGAKIYIHMIFTHGFYHADPHPGNFVVLPGNRIGLYDFGMVGRIEERLREDIEGMLLAIVNRDTGMLVMLLKRLGNVPAGLDEQAFAADVADFVGHYAAQSLEQFDLSGALNDMVEIIRRYRITLPPQAAMLIKVLVTLEGTTRLLSPQVSLMEMMRPYQRRLLLRRLSPQRQWRKLQRIYMEAEHLLEILPQRVNQILEQVQEGKFDVHLDHRGLGPSVNRLVLGMLASALFVGSSMLLAQRTPPVLFLTPTYFGLERISILGLSGCALSLLIGLRLLRAIGKSGHLDQQL